MPEVSGSRLAALTGKSWRTVRAKLAAAGVEPLRRERGADLFDSAAALAAIYARPDDQALDPARERARRDKEAADALALKNAETRGDIARVSVMAREVGAMLADHRQNALGIPAKLAPALVGLNAATIQDKLTAAIYELLNDLADYQPGRRPQ